MINQNIRNVMRITILLISLLFLFIGIQRKEYYDVNKKATMICFECIGIG